MKLLYETFSYLFCYLFLSLVRQNKLQTLSLRGCPEVDDWFLGRLHVFGESLVELDLSHCSCVTVGGLAALKNLR